MEGGTGKVALVSPISFVLPVLASRLLGLCCLAVCTRGAPGGLGQTKKAFPHNSASGYL